MLNNAIQSLAGIIALFTVIYFLHVILTDIFSIRFITKNKDLSCQQLISKAGENHGIEFMYKGTWKRDRVCKIINKRQIEQYIYNKLVQNIELDQEMLSAKYLYTIDGFEVPYSSYYNSLVSEEEYINMDVSRRIAVLNAFMFRNNMYYIDFTYLLKNMGYEYDFQKFHVDNISEESVFYKYMVRKKYNLYNQSNTNITNVETEEVQKKQQLNEENNV